MRKSRAIEFQKMYVEHGRVLVNDGGDILGIQGVDCSNSAFEIRSLLRFYRSWGIRAELGRVAIEHPRGSGWPTINGDVRYAVWIPTRRGETE